MNTPCTPLDHRRNHGFRSAIIFLTNRCDVGCATCNTRAQPGSTAALSPEWVEKFVTRMAASETQMVASQAQIVASETQMAAPETQMVTSETQLAASQTQISYLTWTGGEPFEAFDALHRGIMYASRYQIHNEVLTSGSWYARHPSLLKTLDCAGKFRLRISLDPEHQKSVSMHVIHALIEDALRANISIGFTLRRIPGMSPEPETIIRLLQSAHPLLTQSGLAASRQFHIIPTIPQTIAPFSAKPLSKNITQSPCKLGFRDLVIGADGRAYPCCGLFGLGVDDDVVLIDDPLRMPLEPVDFLTCRPILRHLAQDGPYSLAVQTGIIPDKLPRTGYTSQCHVCRLIVPLLREG